MSKQLRVWLPDDWADISDQNPDGPFTCVWDDPEAQGAFQISTAEYSGGNEPAPNAEALIRFATDFGNENEWGNLVHTGGGKCVLGLYGTAIFRGDTPRAPEFCQLWLLSNGRDFVFATYFGSGCVSPKELDDAQRIAEGIDFRQPDR